ncbi:hypothetical protein POM88_049276 [Heracleum sosnowskyi]|uniref:Uncharacterized protein n=1 Tax=Heracleum sosnowskyi TaxID=360622 RepID=A0AAD8GXX6_9APIA|nr:hypothetical protein POM88_049276 [Heracleum sosnowskyi]
MLADEDFSSEEELQGHSFELSALFRGDDSSVKVDDGSVSVGKDLMLERFDHVDRAHVGVYLGELLGIPPKQQIVDILVAEDCDPATDSLQHADKNFPAKSWFLGKVRQPGSWILVLILVIAIILALVHTANVYNGHKLQVAQTDAPIGANIAPEADCSQGRFIACLSIKCSYW